ELPSRRSYIVLSYLALVVPTVTLIDLQEAHLSTGMIGSFPTYTIGNVMCSQLFEAATKVPDIERGLDAGNYAPLREWLVENVLRHGRSLAPAEIIERATGKVLGTADYIGYLRRKVAELNEEFG